MSHGNACPSTLTAPFVDGENAEHQCSGSRKHNGPHWCGCSYEWTGGIDSPATVVKAPTWARP